VGAASVFPHSPIEGSTEVFLFFSNRLGCGGSLALSLLVTAVLLLVFVL